MGKQGPPFAYAIFCLFWCFNFTKYIFWPISGNQYADQNKVKVKILTKASVANKDVIFFLLILAGHIFSVSVL